MWLIYKHETKLPPAVHFVVIIEDANCRKASQERKPGNNATCSRTEMSDEFIMPLQGAFRLPQAMIASLEGKIFGNIHAFKYVNNSKRII